MGELVLYNQPNYAHPKPTYLTPRIASHLQKENLGLHKFFLCMYGILWIGCLAPVSSVLWQCLAVAKLQLYVSLYVDAHHKRLRVAYQTCFFQLIIGIQRKAWNCRVLIQMLQCAILEDVINVWLFEHAGQAGIGFYH